MFIKKRSIFHLISLVMVLGLFSCVKKHKHETTSFESLKTRAENLISKKKRSEAIEVLEQMMEEYPDAPNLKDYKLALANIYFDKKEYEAAYQCYKKYYKNNPSDQLAEFANYRGILCKFRQTYGVNHDQTNVKKALKKSEKYLALYEKSEKFSKEIRDIKFTCEKMLIDHEIFVYNFYVRRGMYKSAQARLDYLKEVHTKKHKDLEPQILYLELKLAHHEHNKELEQEKLQQLNNRFVNSQYVAMAQNLVEKKKDEFIF
ncbi:TPA: hypothetical protein DEO28_02805 [Candidatus Dependentiae bacterium]|nr:MAG: Outer membrane assembly lipoprotein YfiO [candidate division TM6 bacterium GW2011_GWE2_31_21]KKP53164.1 MAG: Outer membrane assembly lipoprotein YfiO [candidate division TM6 bacterium GW2011_GWF2_33_332]HBS47983.1 hypothetical protein [Candidatus Dependentiae bacterium]HBZ73413.1 hypothetical protein [Candidatus Dependentiae bacterium]